MNNWLTVGNVATVLVLLYAVLGAVLVVLSATVDVNSELQLSFKAYLEQMAIAAGGLAIGRGLAKR